MSGFWKQPPRMEVLSGMAAGLLGWIALGLVFLAPLAHYSSSSTVCDDGCLTTRVEGTDNLADLALPTGATPLFLEPLSLCLLCLVVSVVLRQQTSGNGWRRLLWGSTFLLVGLIVWMVLAFAAHMIGLLLAPTALLALLTVWASARAHPQPPASGERQAQRQGAARSVEVLCGIAAGFIGLENVGIAVFAPLGNVTTGGGSSCIAHICTTIEIRSKVNSLQTGFISPDGLILVALIVLCLLMIALSAALDRDTRATTWPRVLWVCTLLLGGFVIWTALNTYAFFFGVVLVPALVLALTAAFASLVQSAPAQLDSSR